MQDKAGFCMAFGHFKPDFLQSLVPGLNEPGFDTVLYRFLFDVTVLIFLFPQ